MDSHRNRTVILWLAALAILWGLLVPSPGPSTAQHGGTAWADICRSVGSRLAPAAAAAADAAADADDAAGDRAAHPGIHCPVCLSGQDEVLASAPSGWQVTVAAAAVEKTVHFTGVLPPPPARLHGPHPSRAPPSHA